MSERPCLVFYKPSSRSFGNLVLSQSPSASVSSRVWRSMHASSNSSRGDPSRSHKKSRGQLARLTKSWKAEARACNWCGRDPNDGAHTLEQRGDAYTKQTRWFRVCNWKTHALRGPFEDDK